MGAPIGIATHRRTSSIGRPMLLLLALACALSVGNTYYAQPLLDAIARQLQVGIGTAGLVFTLGQLGYAVGLVLLVPLGDLLPRRRLVPVLLLVSAGALVVVGVAPSFTVLGAAIAVVGLTSVVAQVLVPFAATLAADRDRGRVVGHVMTGLLLGTLLSRTTSGLVAQVAGWRAMFFLASILTAGLALLLFRALPDTPPTTSMSYRALLRSVARLVAREPVLRVRALYGGLGFAALNMFWTPIAFLLARPPYRFSEAAIGAFALITVPLAFTTGTAGRLADLGRGRLLTGGSFVLILSAAGFAVLGSRQLWSLGLAALLVTVGLQTVHVTNQSAIYRLDPDARSRLTTAYMTSFFAGGVAGSALGTTAYVRFGWLGVCALLSAVSLTALAVWLSRMSAGHRPALTRHRPDAGRRPASAGSGAGYGRAS